MDMDNDWVEDVKRWCRAGGTPAPRAGLTAVPGEDEDDGAAFGYEAANPTVQALHWPDATTALSTLPLNR